MLYTEHQALLYTVQALLYTEQKAPLYTVQQALLYTVQALLYTEQALLYTVHRCIHNLRKTEGRVANRGAE